MVGKDASRLEGLLPPLSQEKDWRLVTVREGLSIALYDLLGKALEVPLHLLLGGKRRNVVPGMPVIHVETPEVMARRAGKWASAGLKYLKIKLRGDAKVDLEAVRSIREKVGDRVDLQADANHSYSNLGEAVKAINNMKDLGLSIVEDPVRATLEEFRAMRERIQPILMVDGQAYWPNIFNVVAKGAADIINHHPNNQGGLGTALKIDAVAEAAGIPSAIGSSGIFGIQDAAFQQLSSVIGLSRPCEDIGKIHYYVGPTRGEYYYSGEPTVLERGYPFEKGLITIPDAPGLGIKISRERLANFLEKEVTLP